MQKGFLLPGKRARAKAGPAAHPRPSSDGGASPAARDGREEQGDSDGARDNPTPPAMKRGFLLGGPKGGGGPSKGGNAKSPNESSGGMKRGFLLAGSAAHDTVDPNDGPRVPQCRSDASDAARIEPPVPPKRVVSTSSALLDLEKSPTLESAGPPLQTDDSAGLSLLRVVEDELGDCEGRAAIATQSDDADGHILDSWKGAASEPSMSLPTSIANSQRRPLISEVEEHPLIQEESGGTTAPTTSPKLIAESETDPVAGSNREPAEEKVRTPSLPEVERGEAKSDLSREDSLRFGNEASLLLSRLRRSMKTKKQCGKELQDGSTMSLDAITNEQSAALIKSFLAKHLSGESAVVAARLSHLWQILLGPIAQDYTEHARSRTRKKCAEKSSPSPSLALGLGAMEMLDPSDEMYASLVKVLLDGTEHKSGEEVGKDQKVSALGGIYLLRCRIRCLGIALTGMERCPDEDASATLKGIESESQLLLQKILPALERITDSDAGGRQTVLMTCAADAGLELIEMSSRATIVRHMLCLTPAVDAEASDSNRPFSLESMRLWRDALPMLEKLLAIKRHWTSTREGSNSANTDEARLKCAMSVLDDWADVIRSSRRLFFDQIVGDGLHEGADISAGLNLFWNLAGISFRRQDNAGTDIESCFRVGGMAQTLCQNQECTFGSSIGTIHDYGGYADAEDLISLLQEAAKSTDGIREARKKRQSSEVWTKINHQRAAARAFGARIAKGKKATQSLTKSANLLDSAMSSLVVLLRSDSKPSVAMSVATLSLLWGASPNWMPEQSFSDLLDALQMHASQADEHEEQSDDRIVDPTCRALCVIVARAALQKPATLVPQLRKTTRGRKEVYIEGVLCLLEELPNNQSSENDHPYQTVFDAATSMLLQNIETVPHLRARLRSNPSLYANVPYDATVPLLAEFLVGLYADRKSTAGASAVSTILCSIMTANVNRGCADGVVKCVVSSLLTVDEKKPGNKPNGAEGSALSTTFFNKNCPLWRKALLEVTSPRHAYGGLLLATAKSMIESPSSGVPLALLASLVDTNYDPWQSDAEEEEKVLMATSGLTRYAIDQITLSRKCDDVNEETIFGRLAPLLILRRLPRSYYRAVHRALPTDKETKKSMERLAEVLSSSLKAHASNGNQSNLTREENRLIAELAGHCLPLSSQSNATDEAPVSLFEDVCRDPFAGTLSALRGNDTGNVQPIVAAKAALYAISHAVPLALDNDNGEALLNACSFVLELLNYQQGDEHAGRFRTEVAMLQSGCTHFLAVALDSLSGRKAKTLGESTQTPLVEEIGCSGVTDDPKAEGATVLDALSKIFRNTQSIIRTAEISWQAMYGEFYTLPAPIVEERARAIRFSPASRMAMLNSIVMLAQGSRAEDGRLGWLASNLLPSLVDWASGPIDDDIRHPLCVAAALQVIYTLLARCGSFDWLSRCPISEASFVRSTLRCALASFHTSGGENATTNALRLAALKAMLAVIALTQEVEPRSEGGLAGYLTPTEIQTAMSALHGAANVDQNPEIRRLAGQVLPYLS